MNHTERWPCFVAGIFLGLLLGIGLIGFHAHQSSVRADAQLESLTKDAKECHDRAKQIEEQNRKLRIELEQLKTQLRGVSADEQNC